MRILIGALAVALLAGCTMSMEEARQKGPVARFTSPKGPESVASCIAPTWTSQSYRMVTFDAIVQPRRDGGLMVKTIGANEAVDILKDGQGAALRYYTANPDSTDGWSQMRIKGIRSCL